MGHTLSPVEDLEFARKHRLAHLSPTDAEKIGHKIGPTADRQLVENDYDGEQFCHTGCIISGDLDPHSALAVSIPREHNTGVEQTIRRSDQSPVGIGQKSK